MQQDGEYSHSTFFKSFVFCLDEEEIHKDNFKCQPHDVNELVQYILSISAAWYKRETYIVLPSESDKN